MEEERLQPENIFTTMPEDESRLPNDSDTGTRLSQLEVLFAGVLNLIANPAPDAYLQLAYLMEKFAPVQVINDGLDNDSISAALLERAEQRDSANIYEYFNSLSSDFQNRIDTLSQTFYRSNVRTERALDTIRKDFEQVEGFETELKQARREQNQLQVELHEYLVVTSLGLDPDNARIRRFLPVRIYMTQYDPVQLAQVSNAVKDLLGSIGFSICDDFAPEFGSVLKKWFAKSQEALRQPEVQKRLEEVEHGLKLATLKKLQAEVDEKQAQAAARLLDAMKDDGICQVGSVLAVRVTGADGHSRCFVRTLTTDEMIELEKRPDLLKNPAEILEALAHCRMAQPEPEFRETPSSHNLAMPTQKYTPKLLPPSITEDPNMGAK